MSALCRSIVAASVRFPCLVLLPLLGTASVPSAAQAQQQPVAIVASAGIDRLLEDVDYVFDAAGQPQHAQMIRGVLANFNDLRGLDRDRPAGLLLYFPAAGQKGPQPLLFFPVSNVDELLTSVRIGTALRLERAEGDDRLTLFTEDGQLPIRLQHGFAFLDPTKSSIQMDQSLPDPQPLLGDTLDRFDAAVVILREGIPPFLFEVVLGQVRSQAMKDLVQKSGESDVEYAIRRQVTENAVSLAEAVVTEWRSATIGLRLSAADRIAELEAVVAMADDGEVSRFLAEITGGGSRFQPQLSEPSAFAVSANWQPTQAGREILDRALTVSLDRITKETGNAPAEIQSAVKSLIHVLEATSREGQFDSFLQLTGAPPNGFVLVGAAAVAEADQLAAGLEQLLPFAEGSKDIRSIDMAVARAGEVAIHRIWPQELRKQDRRLYGDDAAIYLAAGQGAFWFAIGDVEAMDSLSGAIGAASPSVQAVLARPGPGSSNAATALAGPPLLSVTVLASDWVGLARSDDGGKNARLARLARAAFENPEEDRFHLQLAPTANGLKLNISLDHGYVRLLGLALSESIQQN